MNKYFTASVIVALLIVSPAALGFGGWNGGTIGSGDQYDGNGSYPVTSERGGSRCTVHRPTSTNDRHPVILWGNGTGSSPTSYSGLLRHWASWGFIVVAANTSNAGTGEEMLGCLDWLSSSSLVSLVDLANVGTSGHSQGGGGAIMAGADPRVTTTAPIEGYTVGLGHSRSSWGEQSGPMLILSGSADRLVSPSLNHSPLFSRLTVPTFWAILQGASHFEPVGDGGGFRAITTAWFLYQLKGDTEAAAQFEGSDCGYCGDMAWDVQQKQL